MKKHVIGIDEAGRGPLAGPVSVGTVLLFSQSKLPLSGLKDSKKLSEKQREECFARIRSWQKEGKLQYAVSLVSHSVIDAKGISFAIRSGIARNLKKLDADPKFAEVLLDGSLKAPQEYTCQKTIIKGDEKIPVISLASIVAKVTRDRAMKRLGKKYPQYGFEIHKGYGTLSHRKMIQKYGPCEIHRKTFLRNFDSKSF